MDKDVLKQNRGPQQGNIHHDSDEGVNSDGKQGSTLTKSKQNEAEPSPNNEETSSSSGRKDNEESDTLGIP